MRIVLDTNVLLAAFIAHGACSDLLEHCALQHTIVLSPFIINEMTAKLTGRFRFTAAEAEDVVLLLKSKAEIVTPAPLPRRVCRDHDDDAIIATAITGRCDCIVTGDKDLLVLKRVKAVHIIPPGHFWKFEDRFLS